ncbi:MAG TPA: hypothetical protein VN857_02580 [Chthoniobacterales bacterium]|nr:hypothetical protein [Chthoniobacterales bacterium]
MKFNSGTIEHLAQTRRYADTPDVDTLACFTSHRLLLTAHGVLVLLVASCEFLLK